eukprot:5246047-Pyramimonas_sp.AAC.1
MPEQIRGAGAEVDKLLADMYGEWCRHVEELEAGLLKGCPDWKPWAESENFPTEEQAVALIQNPSYKKLAVMAQK